MNDATFCGILFGMEKIDFSVVVLTHNNLICRYGILAEELDLLTRQKGVNLEILVVDNFSEPKSKSWLKGVVKSCAPKAKVRLIENDRDNLSRGRNLGAKKAKGEYIVFMDDDMLTFDPYTFLKLKKLSAGKIYGYSATRLWTKPEWLETFRLKGSPIAEINEDFEKFCAEPSGLVRGKNDNKRLVRTYIGNFGFVKKEALKSVGWWDERYIGYGKEDNDLCLRMLLKFGKPELISPIKVAHLWHTILQKDYKELDENAVRYQKVLNGFGVKKLDMSKVLYGEDGIDYL